MKKHHVSFLHALDGIKYAIKSQPNFLIHLCLALVSIVFAVITHLDTKEWVVLILIIVLGLVIELINTAIESVVDLVTQEWKESAKFAKDTAAAAMLVFAIGAVFVAALLFIPKFFS